jgi:hypothetical protein
MIAVYLFAKKSLPIAVPDVGTTLLRESRLRAVCILVT